MNDDQIATVTGIPLDHPLINFMREIGMPGNCRFRVIVAGATVELFLTTLIRHHKDKLKGDVEKLVKRTFGQKIELLQKAKILSERRVELLNHFRDMRNNAAHEVKFQITKDDIKKFPVTLVSADKLAEHIIVFHICGNLAFHLWNEHADVLTQYFFTEQECNKS